MRIKIRPWKVIVGCLAIFVLLDIVLGYTMWMIPRLIERARLRETEAVFHAIEAAMAQYHMQNSTFPPAYGFIDYEARQAQLGHSDGDATAVTESAYYHLKPYLAHIGLYGVDDIHDLFGDSYDINRNGRIDRQEFSPVGTRSGGAEDPVEFPTERFSGANNPEDVACQLGEQSHPLVYAPVNLTQFRLAEAYWLAKQDFDARTWDATDPMLAQVSFPPSTYDAYVLISAGPGESYFGVVPEDDSGVVAIQARDWYHVQAMRTYFLATRDLNRNHLLDFDFYARTRQGEGAHHYSYKNATVTNELPTADPNHRNSFGPIIKKFSV